MYLAKVHYKDKDASKILTKALQEIIQEETIFVCIGTNKVIFDSLGPIIGELVKHCNKKIKIYGNLDNVIDGITIPKKIKKIKSLHKNKVIVAIDACVSNNDPIGTIIIKKGPLKPGTGAGNNLEEIGNYSIFGIVGAYKDNLDKSLYNIELNFIKDLAEVISLSILLSSNTK